MSEYSETRRETMAGASAIRALTVKEYAEILQAFDVALRISDGTPEGTWRFWYDDDQLWYRRLIWTGDKTESVAFLAAVLDDGDSTTQLVKGVVGDD